MTTTTTIAAQKIYYNKYLLEYIYEFDATYRERFKHTFVVTRSILENTHIYWYNRYEKELLKINSDLNLVLQFQSIFFDTLKLWDETLFV